MAASSLPPKSIFHLSRNPASIPPTQFSKRSFSHFLPLQDLSFSPKRSESQFCPNAQKKNPWLDPFDDGEDKEMEYGELFTDGKQEENPRLPDDPNSPYGFLKFPKGYNVEVASIGLKVRGDVRRCCCVISGGVYENLLFFPVIQLIKDRYPGVQVDVVASERGKQTYELNKNVRWADVYDPDEDFPELEEYSDMLGLLRGRYYDMILSTKLAGLGHAAFLFMSTARDRVSYIFPNVNSAGAGLLLSQTFTPNTLNLSDGGYNMYQEMAYWLGRPFKSVPRQPILPLQVSISRKVKEAVEVKYRAAGAEKGKYIVLHGLQSDSKASMQSRGDEDSLLSIEVWAEVAYSIGRKITSVFVIPHEKERENVEEIVGDDASIVFVTTPGQLAALVNDSVGVIATNTAAIQFAYARGKPCIALFGSEEKGKLFAPNADERKCTIIASKTGKLADIDVAEVKSATRVFKKSLALV